VYNGHGDVVALTDASGTSVAAYGYDAWGAVTVDTEHFGNGWRNPYLYDGRDGARYDAETGLCWLSVRAYDPTLGRFLAHDPLGRAPLFFADQPYAYAGNNPLLNVDPSGARMATSDDAGVRVESAAAARTSARHAQRQARVRTARPKATARPSHSARPTRKAAFAFSLTLHVTIKPNWWNADAVFDFLRAMLYAGGAFLSITAGIALLNAGPEALLTGMAAIMQGVDFVLHAFTEAIRAVFGQSSGAYNILSTLTVIMDIVSALFDALALASLGAEGAAAEVAEVAAPLLSRVVRNAKALHEVGVFFGVDIKGLLDDLNAIVDGHLP
jgi:RHS repeat-associated protein